jgi:hypothetical protein
LICYTVIRKKERLFVKMKQAARATPQRRRIKNGSEVAKSRPHVLRRENEKKKKA